MENSKSAQVPSQSDRILHIDTSFNCDESKPAFYFPAGSLSSHCGSLFDNEDDAETTEYVMDSYRKFSRGSDEDGSFHPTNDNIIAYEQLMLKESSEEHNQDWLDSLESDKESFSSVESCEKQKVGLRILRREDDGLS